MPAPEQILVTGSGGIVGRHLMRELARLAPGARLIRNAADLTDPEAIRAQAAAIGPLDLVIHLAALVPVADVAADPARAYAVNAGGTINLLQALKGSPARLLLCSTGHVYASADGPLAEDAPKAPVSVYGQSKYLAERAAEEICAATGRALCIGRLFSIHDPEQAGSFLRPALERRLAGHDYAQPFELMGGNSLRDFLTAAQAARLLARLALSAASGPVNVASGRATRVADFARSLAPRPLDIRAAGGSDSLVADISRLTAILGDLND